MRFWSGFGGHERDAAKTCARGGWIPVSQRVVERAEFQSYLAEQPLFAKFVELAARPNQLPIPVIPGAAYFDREIRAAGQQAMSDPAADPREILQNATLRIQRHLDRTRTGEP